jgi:hypothetical protein
MKMITLIAAAIAAAAPAAAPAAPMQMPADAHAQHQQAPQGHEQHGQMAAMGDDCCCKDMMEKMHSGHYMDGKKGHQEHTGR